jgi:RNA 2',3'-cyclic 3'-phosphodiesterase
MRTFVALNLPADARLELHAALEPLRQRPVPVRWADADALHLTLKFLGEIEGVEVARIQESMAALVQRHDPVTLDIAGFGAFPSLRRASVLWIGVEASAALAALQRDVELAFSRLGYAREQRPFRPHITVGRTRSGGRPPDIERLASDAGSTARVTVSTLDLMRSHFGGTGARYEPLLRLPLGVREDT